jgi:hypothetical protein
MQQPEIRAYSTKDLVLMYEVSRKTIYRWYQGIVDSAGARHGQKFTPKQVEMFFDCWGHPKHPTPEAALKALNPNKNT